MKVVRHPSNVIFFSELIPPPPPPYNSAVQDGPSQPTTEAQQPQMSIFTVAGSQLLVPEDNKLPKYEDIFPGGPPSSDYFEDFDELSLEAYSSRQSSQDPIIIIERY